MMRRLFAAFCATTLATVPADAALHRAALGPPPSIPACTVISGGCAGAWNINRVAVPGYTGPLLQVDVSGTKTAIGAVRGIVNATQELNLCGATLSSCRVSRIYDQSGSGNDLISPTAGTEGFLVWDADGWPIVITSNAQYLEASNVTGLPTGSASKSVAMFGSNVATNPNGYGAFGFIGNNNTTAGYMFSVGVTFPTSGLTGYNWHFEPAPTQYALVDEEQFDNVSSSLGTSFFGIQDILIAGTYSQSSNQHALYVNGALVSGPSTPTPVINAQAYIGLGIDGDTTSNGAAFQEGYIVSHAMSATENLALNANVSGFYKPAAANARAGGVCSSTMEPPGAAAAYATQRLFKAWVGPARTYQRSDGMRVNIAFAANGCDLDTASLNRLMGGLSVAGVYIAWDQTGNGWNAWQATSIQQPGYVASGIDGKPSDVSAETSSTLLATIGGGIGSGALYPPDLASNSAMFTVFEATNGTDYGNESGHSNVEVLKIANGTQVCNNQAGPGIGFIGNGSLAFAMDVSCTVTVTGASASVSGPHAAFMTIDSASSLDISVCLDSSTCTTGTYSGSLATSTSRQYYLDNGNEDASSISAWVAVQILFTTKPSASQITAMGQSAVAYWGTPGGNW